MDMDRWRHLVLFPSLCVCGSRNLDVGPLPLIITDKINGGLLWALKSNATSQFLRFYLLSGRCARPQSPPPAQRGQQNDHKKLVVPVGVLLSTHRQSFCNMTHGASLTTLPFKMSVLYWRWMYLVCVLIRNVSLKEHWGGIQCCTVVATVTHRVWLSCNVTPVFWAYNQLHNTQHIIVDRKSVV